MPANLSLDALLSPDGVAFDVRSPSEFIQGHIPGTISLPLMDDEDRHLIGIAYKQHGQDYAIELGFERLAPKLLSFFKKAKEYIVSKKDPVKVLCWRGGMRSGFVARLFESFGFKTATLQGGYKTYRRWIMKTFDSFDAPAGPTFHILGGMTGTGKTSLLKALKERGEQVIDLEGIASHRGSSFGMLGMALQPSTEQFHNEIAFLFRSFDLSHPIWIEDESRLIGKCHVPDPLYRRIQSSRLFVIERPLEERLDNLLVDYGAISKEQLIEATERVSKRLGGQTTKQIVTLIQQGDIREAARAMLSYYDRAYEHSLSLRTQPRTLLSHANLSDPEWANLLTSV